MNRRSFPTVGFVLALLLLAPGLGSGRVEASELLQGLDCAALVLEDVSDETAALDLTYDFLYASLKVGVTENMPRLAIGGDDCANDIYLNVSVVHTRVAGTRSLDFTVMVRLEVRRYARIAEIKTSGMVTVWDASTLFSGDPDDVKKEVMETIRELAAELASASRPDE